MHPMLNIAIQAIRKAGNFIIKQYEIFNKNSIKLNYIDNFISKINKESDRIIIEIIRKFYPLHKIITQNNNYFNNKNYFDNTCWIIGLIDSNINFIKQFPFFALSIAVQLKGNIEIGVIYDPIHNELFSACRGQGAQLNGYRIRISTATNLNNTILAISFAEKKKYIAVDLLKKICNQYINIDFRRTGVVALDLAYVASGRVDGCFAIFLKETSQLLTASGALIIRESGGLITDFTKNNNYLLSDNIVAGSPKIIKAILSIV